MTLGDVIDYLADVKERGASDEAKPSETLAALKAEAVSILDEPKAKLLWCLQTVLRVQNLYLTAFNRLKLDEFYQAWCDFEQVEIGLRSLERHLISGWREFRLDEIKKHTSNWQSLFPYRLFLSPEMACKAECSICGRFFRPRNSCEHVVGEIYGGERCVRVMKDVKLLGVSMVSNPVQKYSVLFAEESNLDSKHHRYEAVRFATRALRQPFDDWDVEKGTCREPHSHFGALSRNQPCPCESGKKYKKCCLPEAGVLRPHLYFDFAVAAPEDLPKQWFPEHLRHKARHKVKSKPGKSLTSY